MPDSIRQRSRILLNRLPGVNHDAGSIDSDRDIQCLLEAVKMVEWIYWTATFGQKTPEFLQSHTVRWIYLAKDDLHRQGERAFGLYTGG